MTQLTAENLAKSYRGHEVVRDVSLKVTSGEVVGLLGPNGAGKTTCFYMIVGSIPHDRGRVCIDNAEITGLPVHERARKGIGYLPQEASVFRKLSVRENLLAILETRTDLSRDEQQVTADQLMEDFRIAHLQDNIGISLSGGERRRVEIARALATNPVFILLDEPFAGVDPISVNDIKEIVRHLTDRGIGVLITDHNVRETLDICDKAYIVNDGQIIAEGDAARILADEQVKNVYLGQNFRM
ncbi:MAG: LPS export ABC transporter ATP-binding protein [Gammaproteobacteria bacterium]|jgi:lipopolysaccharide export system ATP-binding protein|nr:LPS export ABC transporter ATP-binding protein [Gammaproteobacteria bacterium]MBT4494281.1 LPS export ABC transporter ATP-binding protein [Gammaproteobacteria bacterium]MBT7370890.1 LPS export ABC transporter ATP-binding protein [Gammaproteobacteria bacterium]